MTPSLEDKVEGILKELIASNTEYKYHRNYAVEGQSGYRWKTDLILMKEGVLDAVMECKDIGGEEWERKTRFPNKTFETHMCRAYVLLNDLHLKYPEVRLYVIVREFPASYQLLGKWENVFKPIGTELMCLKMIHDDSEYFLLSRP